MAEMHATTTVLVVEDDDDCRRLVRLTLEGPETRVLEAPTVRQALALLGEATLDACIVDWNLPDLAGTEVVLAVRERAKGSALPVLMLTARDDEAAREAALAAGADLFLSKPFSPLELLEAVESLIRRAGRPRRAR